MTYVFYDGEEVEESRNGLRRLAEQHPDWLAGRLRGAHGAERRAGRGRLPGHPARRGRRRRATRAQRPRRGWGDNAIHDGRRRCSTGCGPTSPARVSSTGWSTTRGSTRCWSTGGVAGNVIPDECVVTVNFRFAPDRVRGGGRGARARRCSTASRSTSIDGAGGAPPGLDRPAATRSSAAIGRRRGRSSAGPTSPASPAIGVPAVNYGPGDPNLAHTREEYVPEAEIVACEDGLLRLAPGLTPAVDHGAVDRSPPGAGHRGLLAVISRVARSPFEAPVVRRRACRGPTWTGCLTAETSRRDLDLVGRRGCRRSRAATFQVRPKSLRLIVRSRRREADARGCPTGRPRRPRARRRSRPGAVVPLDGQVADEDEVVAVRCVPGSTRRSAVG